MVEVVSADGGLNRIRLAFIGEFARMNADNDEFFVVFVLQGFQFGQEVKAVDTAISPEIVEDDLPLQSRNGQRLPDVKPDGVVGEFRSVNTPF
jgi:hypothetical protein